MSIKVTFVLNFKPEMTETIAASFGDSLKETRKFQGCLSVNVFKNDVDPNKFILIEEWTSKEDYNKYIAWRSETGMIDAMASVMAVPSQADYWTLVE